ncbi:MAG: DUF2971 domain-containing protein [Flavobacteriaceae bacterium]|nr:DUF2971 domain-containing protein [Flavobacteriaceae bacterium]
MRDRFTDIELPKTLYKYRDWNNKYHRKLISKQELYFPKPSEFNDPFDGNIPVRWDLLSFEECYEKNLELMSIVLKDEDENRVKAFVREQTEKKQLWHPEKLKRETSEQLDKWGKIIGLLSLSSACDNILMWSHYSMNHSGFVVGFDTQSMANDYNFEWIEPVNYQFEYPLISGNDDSRLQFHKKFYYKSKLWEYEKEWRISINHIEKRTVKLNPYSITEIILGCKMNAKATNQIIKLSKRKLRNNIAIFKATKSKDNFGLDIEQLE